MTYLKINITKPLSHPVDSVTNNSNITYFSAFPKMKPESFICNIKNITNIIKFIFLVFYEVFYLITSRIKCFRSIRMKPFFFISKKTRTFFATKKSFNLFCCPAVR